MTDTVNYVSVGYWADGYTTVNTAITSEIQKLTPSAIIELYEIDASVVGGTIYRFHSGKNLGMTDVVWQGNTYSAFPIEASDFEWNGKGQMPRPKVQVSNVLGTITALVLAYQDLVGCKFTRIRTLAKYLDAVNFPAGTAVVQATPSAFTYQAPLYYAAITPTTLLTAMSDGITSAANFGGGAGANVFATPNQSGNFLQMDLGSIKLVDHITLRGVNLNPDGWGVAYLNGCTISISSNGSTYTSAGTVSGMTNDGVAKDFAIGASARYIKIAMPGTNWMAIGDFIAYTQETVYVNPTADPTAEFPRDIYYVDRKSTETNQMVEFELAASLDLAGVALPRRQIIQNYCPWAYRSSECGYTGTNYFDTNDSPVATLAQDVCGKRLSSCRCRFGQYAELPYGGFPAAGLLKV